MKIAPLEETAGQIKRTKARLHRSLQVEMKRSAPHRALHQISNVLSMRSLKSQKDGIYAFLPTSTCSTIEDSLD